MSRSEHSSSPSQRDLSQVRSELDLVALAQNRRQRFHGIRQKLDRLWQLIWTFPPRQVAARIFKRIKSRLGLVYRPTTPASEIQVRDSSSNQNAFEWLFLATLEDTRDDLAALQQGDVCLLNQTRKLGTPLDWSTSIWPRPSHLWRFQLHYHEFLLWLVAGKHMPTDLGPQDHACVDLPARWALVWASIRSWIESNQVTHSAVHDDAWHPYCISRRIPIWFKLLAAPDNHLSASERADIEQSAFHQADFLSHNLETDLRGNHLLENLHALGMAGCYFQGTQPDRWLALARERLMDECHVQVLESGEHFERSPMYHCVVLGNFLQLSVASAEVDASLAKLMRQRAEQMGRFLDQILLPDGEIPLLADSCFGEAPSVAQLRRLQSVHEFEPTDLSNQDSRAGSLQSTTVLGDYWLHRRERDYLLLDAGPVAAAQLPAHGHGDLLNVVGAIDGQRLLVDSGNGSYDLDEVRVYCRSSVAHNVLTLNAMDHADVWSKFRMGRAGKPGRLETGSQAGFEWARCAHNAYAGQGWGRVERCVASHADCLIWVCADRLVETASSSTLDLEGYLHFHPQVALQRDGDQLLARLPRPQDPEGALPVSEAKQKVDGKARATWVRIGFFGIDDWELAKSIYCPEFGKKVDNLSVVYSASSRNASMLGWYLVPCDPRLTEPLIELDILSSTTIAVTQANGVRSNLDLFR